MRCGRPARVRGSRGPDRLRLIPEIEGHERRPVGGATVAQPTDRKGRGEHAPDDVQPQAYLGSGKALLVAVSRSGTTTETVQAVERFQSEARGDVLTISNYEEALSRRADGHLR